MIFGEKVGVGIVTYNRPDCLNKLLDSLEQCEEQLDSIVVVNDGDEVDIDYKVYDFMIHNQKNEGVGKSKNRALRYLMDKNCKHYFLFEDDIFVKDPKVFEEYIKASKLSGIQHFNFSQHGLMNKKPPTGEPNELHVVDYDGTLISFFPHVVGAMSYYSKKCLDVVGLMDEEYYNACEHVDHTYRIINAGLHPWFWRFADIKDSHKMLGDKPWKLSESTISSSPNHKQIMKDADEIFYKKFGCYPTQIPHPSKNEFFESLKTIKKEHGTNTIDMCV